MAKETVGQASVPANANIQNGDFFIYKRRLPHWRMTGVVYFVTWRLEETQSELTPKERDVVASTLQFFDSKRYELLVYVVMNDHVHVLTKPFDEYRLQDIIHSWKSYTANTMQKRFGRRASLWQGEYFDRIVRDENEFIEKAQYIINNPLMRWPELEKYNWIWYQGIEAGTEACPTVTKDK